MRLSEVAALLGCDRPPDAHEWPQIEIAGAFAADLMSEVLAFCGHGAVLLTGLTSVQSVHTAHLADLHAIVFVNGKQPDPAVATLARDRGLPLLSTSLTLYEACARLHDGGLPASRKRA